MRMILVSGAVVFLAISTSAFGADKSGAYEINKEKKEGTVNLSKDGTWKGGAT